MKEKNVESINFEVFVVCLSLVDILLIYFYIGNLGVMYFNVEEFVVLVDYFFIIEVKVMVFYELELKVNVVNCLFYFMFVECYDCE